MVSAVEARSSGHRARGRGEKGGVGGGGAARAPCLLVWDWVHPLQTRAESQWPAARPGWMPSYCSAVAVNQEAGGPMAATRRRVGLAGNVI